MWDKIKSWFAPEVKEEPKEPVKSYVMDANISLKKQDLSATWRPGMWVMVGDRVAILHVLTPPSAEVHFVDETDGQTILVQHVTLNELRQAKYREIPYCRRVDFPMEVAVRYGYGD